MANGHQDQVLERLNKLLLEDLSANLFVTFAVALVDPPTSNLKVLSAGHGPILWYRYETDEIETLEAQGIPLGMLPGAKYGGAKEVHLAPGDMLVLITDGIYEWANPEGEEFGLTRLESVIREFRNSPPDKVIQKLHEAVINFCRGTKQLDDLTAVILRRRRPSTA
jgi:serine phosphatase RsbU (regulator of sigma subunit)